MPLASWPRVTTGFSEDTEYQILSRISSIETLDRCKAVCKRWYNIINENSFMPSYCQNTGNLYGFLLQVPKNEPTCKLFSKALVNMNQQDSSSFIPSYTKFDVFAAPCLHKIYPNLKFDDDIEILASSMQGIVFCGDHNYAAAGGGVLLYVCKPTIGLWTRIPHPSSRSVPDMVGLMVRSNQYLKYKIIWISSSYSDVDCCYKYCHEIYDSRKMKWSRRVKLLLPSSESSYNKQGIQVGKFLYFLMETLVLAFHGDNDKTFQIPFHQYIISSPNVSKKAIEYQGKLGLICTTSTPRLSSMQIWIHEDHQKTWTSWKKIKEVDMSFLGLYSVYPVGFYSADILVLQRSESLITCNLHDSTYWELELNNFGSKSEIFPYRSDREFTCDILGVKDFFSLVCCSDCDKLGSLFLSGALFCLVIWFFVLSHI